MNPKAITPSSSSPQKPITLDVIHVMRKRTIARHTIIIRVTTFTAKKICMFHDISQMSSLKLCKSATRHTIIMRETTSITTKLYLLHDISQIASLKINAYALFDGIVTAVSSSATSSTCWLSQSNLISSISRPNAVARFFNSSQFFRLTDIPLKLDAFIFVIRF